MQSRIGIFGGTFAPFHVGHRWIIKDMIDTYQLSDLYIIPTIVSYHRAGKDRCPMLESTKREIILRMCHNLPYFYSSRIHLDESEWEYRNYCRGLSDEAWNDLVGGRRFIHTLLDFCIRHRIDLTSARPYVCLGTDSFKNLDKWYHGLEIQKLCTLVVVQGRNDDVVKRTDVQGYHQSFMPYELRGVSATRIREAMLNRNWNHYLEDVERYDRGEVELEKLGWCDPSTPLTTTAS